MAAFGAALIPVQFAYGGWQTACFVAGEVRESAKKSSARLIPRRARCNFDLSFGQFCLRPRVRSTQVWRETKTPASAVMRLAFGENGARIIAAGIAVSTLGFLSQSMLTAPRVYFAMAEDGLFFQKFGQIKSRPRTGLRDCFARRTRDRHRRSPAATNKFSITSSRWTWFSSR